MLNDKKNPELLVKCNKAPLDDDILCICINTDFLTDEYNLNYMV